MIDKIKNYSVDNNRKVIVVACYYPPAGGVGVFRITKFVKYLPLFKWQPLVLTLQSRYYDSNVWEDSSFNNDILPDIKVFRTRALKRLLINDIGLRWLPFLFFHLVGIIRKEKPDLLFLTGGPFSQLIIAPIMKLIYKLPYILDLRDPWKVGHHRTITKTLKAKLGYCLTNVMEPVVIKYSAKVICVSEFMANNYRRAYQLESRDKFDVITNGYDPDDFLKIQPHVFPEYTVVYTGKFRFSLAFRDPLPFFLAMRNLNDLGYKINFVHVGLIEEEVVELAKQAGILKSIDFIGPRPYHETLAYAMGAHCLLLIGSFKEKEQTTKVFDYMCLNRPIITVAESDSEIARIVKNVPEARLITKNEPNLIAPVLEDLYKSFDTNDYDPGFKVFNQDIYDRKQLTGQLADIFYKNMKPVKNEK